MPQVILSSIYVTLTFICTEAQRHQFLVMESDFDSDTTSSETKLGDANSSQQKFSLCTKQTQKQKRYIEKSKNKQGRKYRLKPQKVHSKTQN